MKHSQLLPLNDESMIKCHLKKFFSEIFYKLEHIIRRKKKSSGKQAQGKQTQLELANPKTSLESQSLTMSSP